MPRRRACSMVFAKYGELESTSGLCCFYLSWDFLAAHEDYHIAHEAFFDQGLGSAGLKGR